jgi:hypothetical protein
MRQLQGKVLLSDLMTTLPISSRPIEKKRVPASFNSVQTHQQRNKTIAQPTNSSQIQNSITH